MHLSKEHIDETKKYEEVYRLQANYRMGAARVRDAIKDLQTITVSGTYLDVGCGRGEMVQYALSTGLDAYGLEVVKDLCDGDRIVHGDAVSIPFDDDAFDYVSCYDVLEHIIPGEEIKVLEEIKRVARKKIFLTANNRRSVSKNGADLHINRKPYEEWDKLIREVFSDDLVTWVKEGREYVSETWHIERKA